MWKALRSSHKPWKSRARFPHFHRAATATLTLKSTQKGGVPQLPALPLLQAHSSIRKDLFKQLLTNVRVQNHDPSGSGFREAPLLEEPVQKIGCIDGE